MTAHTTSQRKTPKSQFTMPSSSVTHWLTAAILGASLMAISSAHAQPMFTAGQRLDTAQIQSMGPMKTVSIDGQTYRVLQTGSNAAGLPYTLVLNTNNTVGQTYHELQVVEQPISKVRQQLAAIASQALEVTYYDRTDITLMRFATLEQAADALSRAQAAMPDAEIGLPVIFSRPKAQ